MTIVVEHDFLDIWKTLRTKPSAAGDRKIEWPKPVPYRTDVLAQLRRQEALGFEAHPTLPLVPIGTPIDWSASPKGDINLRNWLLRFQSLQFIDLYIFAFLETDDALYLHKPLEMLIDWCQHHIIHRNRSEFDWSDMAVGYRSLKFGFFLDAALNDRLSLDGSQAAVLLAAAQRHIAELIDPEKLASNNHGLFQLHGLAVLAGICWAMPGSSTAIAFCETRFEDIVRNQFNHEGVHLEHSPGYHYWASDHLRTMLDSGWLHSRHYDEVSERVEEVKHWLRRPDGRIVPVGDTMTEDVPFRPPGLPPKPDFVSHKDRAMGRWYPEGGYAIYRSVEEVPAAEACMLFVNGAFHSRAHKHFDHLTFEYFHLGRPLIIDAGKPKSLSPETRGYINSTRAHNTIEIDDTDYVTKRIKPYGSALKSFVQTSNGATLLSEIQHKNLKIDHRRYFRISPWRQLDIEDQLRASSARKFTLWLHFHPEAELTNISQDTIEITNKDISARLICRSNVALEMNTYRGVMQPRRVGWAIDDAYELVPTWSVGFTASGDAVDFSTTIVFQ